MADQQKLSALKIYTRFTLVYGLLLWLLFLLFLFLVNVQKFFFSLLLHFKIYFAVDKAIKLLRIANVLLRIKPFYLVSTPIYIFLSVYIHLSKYICVRLTVYMSVCWLFARLSAPSLVWIGKVWSTSFEWVDFPVETHINEVDFRLKSFQLEQYHP